MNNLFRQTSDPEVEEGLQETRPFFWFLILVLVFLYGISLYESPQLRQPALLLPYTVLFFLHILLHWYMPYLVNQRRKLIFYLVVQIVLINLLILISLQQSIVLGLYATLAGETVGILEDWRQSLTAVVTYLALMGITYGLLWGWQSTPDWLGTALLIMVFVLVYVLLFLRQLNAREESQRLLGELQKAHRQLAEYAAQVETLTLEAERQRMARALHDTLAQGLAGLVLQLEALELSLERENANQAQEIASQAKDRARTTLADARRAIDDLRAADMGAAEAVNHEVERFQKATGIPCTLEMTPGLNISKQDGDHVLRCVSEGLANVTRHAQATQVWVTIAEENDSLLIQVRDNGQGFHAAGDIPAGHYGLLGLRERARLANGRLTVESQPGDGTAVTMFIPLQEDRELS
jgi:NarL family two-component system sensor histidine kinase YdfH